ncbi:hypothetical protein B0H14DRAFT_2902129, partial [Mycena olivaceomarginata]
MSCSGTRSATQEQYALLQPARDLQLEMSRVYKIRGSPMQAADKAALVVFYSHAAIGAGTSYVPKSIPRLPRVTIPAFPTSVFRPCVPGRVSRRVAATLHEARAGVLGHLDAVQLVLAAPMVAFRRARQGPQQRHHRCRQGPPPDVALRALQASPSRASLACTIPARAGAGAATRTAARPHTVPRGHGAVGLR